MIHFYIIMLQIITTYKSFNRNLLNEKILFKKCIFS